MVPETNTIATPTPPLLRLDQVSASFTTRRGVVPALSAVDFTLEQGEILAFVGESGAGKSLLGSCINGLLPRNCSLTGGSIWFEGERIDGLGLKAMERIRGARIGTIFQDPLTSLNPLYTVSQQIVRTLKAHQEISQEDAERRALELLDEVGIPGAAARLHSYPHEFSGGMRQRVVIALALALRPKLIIADEPTTALDVSVQAQILDLLRRQATENGTSVILVTHDMGVVAETADRVAVIYSGRMVEVGKTAEVLTQPRHPYTRGLLGAIPSLTKKLDRLPQIPGSMPSLRAVPSGCAFNPRCTHAVDRCRTERPHPVALDNRAVACHLVAEDII